MEDNQDLNKKIGLRIKLLRENAGEYQKETAYKINISEGSLGLYEIGLRKVPPNIITALAIHFQTTTDYILCLTDDPKKEIHDQSKSNINGDTQYATNLSEKINKVPKSEREAIKKEIDKYAEFVINKYFDSK